MNAHIYTHIDFNISDTIDKEMINQQRGTQHHMQALFCPYTPSFVKCRAKVTLSWWGLFHTLATVIKLEVPWFKQRQFCLGFFVRIT